MATKSELQAAQALVRSKIEALPEDIPDVLDLTTYDQHIPDSTNYTKSGSPYLGYCSPYNKGALIQGVDFEDFLHVTSAQWPNRSRFKGFWPAWAGGVRGYMHISRGNYDGGAPNVSTPSKRVSSLSSFTETVGWKSIASGNFNLLDEFYLTSTLGNPNTKTAEIGFFLHAPPSTLSYLNVGEAAIGKPNIDYDTYTSNIDGSTWVCRSLYNPSKPGARYITFVLKVGSSVGVDYASGEMKALDKRSVLLWLIGKGAITGDEFVNGAANGIEPTLEGGSYDVLFPEWTAVWS